VYIHLGRCRKAKKSALISDLKTSLKTQESKETQPRMWQIQIIPKISSTNTKSTVKSTIKSKLKSKLKLSKVNIFRVLLKEVKLLKSTRGCGNLFHVFTTRSAKKVHLTVDELRCLYNLYVLYLYVIQPLITYIAERFEPNAVLWTFHTIQPSSTSYSAVSTVAFS